MIKYIKPYRFSFAVGSFAKLMEAFLELYLPLLMGRILDIAITSGDRKLILETGTKMLVFVLFGFICATICQYSAAIVSQGTGREIRSALIDKVSSLSFSNIDEIGTSTLINRMTSDVNNIQTAVAMTIRLVTRAPFIGIGAVIMSLRIHPKMAFIFLALIPVVAVVMYFFATITPPLYTKSQNALDSFTMKIREQLNGVRVIRAFANGSREEKQVEVYADSIRESEIKVNDISSWLGPTSSVILNSSILMVLYFGATYVFRGEITQGSILSFTIYATKILYALGVIANLIVIFTKASSSSERILAVLEIPEDKQKPETSIFIDYTDDPALSVEELTFGYSRDHPILSDINFSLSSGSTLGIVGITGSGTTTLLHLLQRHYPISIGSIHLFGRNINTYQKEELVNIYAMVPQENMLFSGSIKENLKMYAPDALDDELEKALKTAQCFEFVMELENGWDTLIYEGGKNFSGGQRQRLAIARALASNPKILILDDSLSALDYKTDLKFRQALDENYREVTKVIASQRISSVINADDILVLHDGMSVGYGSHEELMLTSPEYKKLIYSQQELGDSID